MPRIPTRILTSQPQGTSNPAVKSGRSLAPMNSQAIGPAQPRLQFRDFPQNRQQSAVRQSLGRTSARYDADQQVIPGVAFTGGTQAVIPHGLGRAWVGCAIQTPIGGYLSYQVVHNADVRLDAFQLLVTCANTITADVVVW